MKDTPASDQALTRVRSRGNATLPPDVLGKIQPQALELEEAVLGAMMMEQSAVNAVIDVLKPESFYRDAHRRIFAAIVDLFHASEPIDILTVTETLRKLGDLQQVGGAQAVAALTTRVASTANIEAHARIISQKYIQRELIRVSSVITQKAFEETTDVLDLLDEAESQLFEVAQGNIRKSYESMSSIMRKALEDIDNARNQEGGVSGVASGFVDLDRITGGFQKSDMIVFAARPGMGKTAFVLTMARNITVEYKVPVAVFSLEMSAVQLVQRLISAETEISSDKFRKGNLQPHEYTQLHERIGKLSDAPLYIDDTPALSIFELRAKCRRLKSTAGIEMVIIDYLQLMTAGSNNGNREQEISSISRSIKSIAKELDIPIIALSQLSRMVETRGGDKRPILSDLRESGAIEQDADMVAFIYRAEYYGLTDHPDGIDTAGLGELILAKHRHGALGSVNLRFIKRLAKFANYDSFVNPVFDRGEFQDGLRPNEDFTNHPTMTMPSKMNEKSAADDAGDSPF
ncbi:MAG: replicative DNA helicase [Flavobacteriales bacterium]